MRTPRIPPWATVDPQDVGMVDAPATSIPLATPAPAGTVDLGVLPEVNVPAPAVVKAASSDTTKTTASQEPWQVNAAQAVAAQGRGTAKTGGGQWLRQIKLVVYGEPSTGPGKIASRGDGTGLDLSNLRINFSVRKKCQGQSANLLTARVYNLSKPSPSNPNAPNTVGKIRQYGRVQLSCGYAWENNMTMIFDGSVVLYIVGKENAVDSYVEIIAGDADEHLHESHVGGLTWPAGSTPSQRCRDMLNQAGCPIGQIVPAKGEQKSIRAQSYIGMLNKGIRREINATNSDFWIDNGKAYIIPWDGYVQSEIVHLSPQTGLVNIPKVTPNGIEVDCLLNPKLRLGGLVSVESDLLSDVPFVPGAKNPFSGPGGPPIGTQAAPAEFTYPAAATNPVGIYKILLLNHFGDTRQNEWKSSIVGAASGSDGKLLQSNNPGTALQRTVVT